MTFRVTPHASSMRGDLKITDYLRTFAAWNTSLMRTLGRNCACYKYMNLVVNIHHTSYLYIVYNHTYFWSSMSSNSVKYDNSIFSQNSTMPSIITWYYIYSGNDTCCIFITLWTHKGHSIPHPHTWAMGCSLGVFWRKLSCYKKVCLFSKYPRTFFL